MAITQLNTAAYDYAMFLPLLNKAYKGKAEITLSEYDTDAAPVVKVGSVFEDNGALFLIETADMTPSGYAGITNSTTFYLYYDEDSSPKEFIYSNTAPVWSDVLQGWYNSNDRALFSMYKDSGGTLYQAKNKLEQASNLLSKTIPIGSWDMDATASVFIPHGLGSHSKVRGVNVVISKDDETQFIDLRIASGATNIPAGYIGAIGDTSVVVGRVAGESFDNTDFDDTTINRGWVTVWYVE